MKLSENIISVVLFKRTLLLKKSKAKDERREERKTEKKN
jgi:hypothetical protein